HGRLGRLPRAVRWRQAPKRSRGGERFARRATTGPAEGANCVGASRRSKSNWQRRRVRSASGAWKLLAKHPAPPTMALWHPARVEGDVVPADSNLWVNRARSNCVRAVVDGHDVISRLPLVDAIGAELDCV